MATNGKKISELTEVLSVDTNNDYVVISRNGDNKKLKVANMMGSTNVGDNYIDLTSYEDNKNYRLIINDDGKVQIFPKESVIGHTYAENDNLQVPLKLSAYVGNSKTALSTASNGGIVINQMYGGGDIIPSSTIQAPSISHSFVELYNCNIVDINLCGLYLHYKGNSDTTWQTLALRGYLPAHSSFLIRGKQHGDMLSDLVRCKIYDYDQEWLDTQGKPVAFSRDGMSMYLSTNSTPPQANENPNRYLITTNNEGVSSLSYVNGYYVDLLGVGSADGVKNPVAYEKFYWSCMDKDTAIRRIDFYNNKNNKYDAQPINYKTCNIEHYRPRSLRDGIWDNYCDKIKINPNTPNLINITFGEQTTTRYFTWQSIVTDNGCVRYRRIKDVSGNNITDNWKEVESEREIVYNHNAFATVHRVKLENLATGLYEYKCGETGYWSDEEMFEVRGYNDNSTIKILITTDQQGFTEPEYKAWNTCVNAMKTIDSHYNTYGLPIFDLHINLGDISQNAKNLYEWLYYNKYAREYCKNIPHHATIGNNDLVDKKYGSTFDNYFTYENQPMLNDYHKGIQATTNMPMVSTYSFDIGFTHFICINSNQEQMYVDYGIDQTEFLLKQAYYLDRDLWKVSKRATKPKWVVVYAHLSPFSITRAKRLQHWIPVVEHYGVDLFICGHNHTYNRSIPIKCGYNGSTSESNYNTYVPKSGFNYTLVNELQSNGSEINRSANISQGTYYLLYQASSSKISGKEKAIDMSKLTFLDSNGSTVTSGTNYTKHFKTGTNRPWWYEYTGALPTQPSFGTLEITQSAIKVKMNYVSNVVSTNKETGVLTVNDYDSSKNTIVNFDNLTINYADRSPAYRTGVSAPYYDENRDY